MVSSNTGRCGRCDASEMKDVYNEGKDIRWCLKFNNFCQRVAWGCKAPPSGYRRECND